MRIFAINFNIIKIIRIFAEIFKIIYMRSRIVKIFFFFSVFFSVFLLFTSFNPQPPQRARFSETPVFKDGEKLNFRVHYSGITGGELTAVLRQTRHHGNDIFHAVLTGRTTGLAERVYKVFDVYESFFNVNTNLPYRAISNIREGNYRFFNDVTFHRQGDFVTCRHKGRVEVPENTMDMAAVLYYVRRLDIAAMRMNDTISVDTYFGRKLFPFQIIYKGRETISINSGTYRCFKFMPVTEVGRAFKNEDDMVVWLSDDQNRIPVSIRFNMRVGSFRCDLISTENLMFPLSAKTR